MEKIYERKTCRLCESEDLALVLQLTPTPIGDAYIPKEHLNEIQETYQIDLMLCNSCGHSQLRHVLNPEILYSKYLYLTSSSLGLVEHFDNYSEEIISEYKLKKGSLVVDIGSNDGVLLNSFKNKEMQVLGIEPATKIAYEATKQGIETLPEFFTQELTKKIKKERGDASVITANNVLSNIDDLTEIAKGVYELLAPDGLFICEIFYLADLMQNIVFDYIYHEHLDYHSVKPLNAFFSRNNLELVNIKKIPTKCGSLRCTVQKTSGQREISNTVDDQISLEAKLGIQSKESFRIFNSKINAAKKDLITLLDELNSKEKTFAAYGASVTSTSLTYHFGLDKYFNFIVDDNPQRQNLFSPGLHLPVLSPQTIYDQHVDYVIILAWRYYKPIIEKNKEFLNKGGHFIVPLPSIKII